MHSAKNFMRTVIAVLSMLIMYPLTAMKEDLGESHKKPEIMMAIKNTGNVIGYFSQGVIYLSLDEKGEIRDFFDCKNNMLVHNQNTYHLQAKYQMIINAARNINKALQLINTLEKWVGKEDQEEAKRDIENAQTTISQTQDYLYSRVMDLKGEIDSTEKYLVNAANSLGTISWFLSYK